MKTSSIKALPVVLAAIAVILIAATAWSKPHSSIHRLDPQRMTDHLAKKLDLTEQQRAAVQPLLTSLSNEAATDVERLHTLRDTLRDQHTNFDEGTARAAAEEIGQLTSNLVFRMASTRADIYQLLNEEQRASLVQLEKKRQARRDNHRMQWQDTLE